MNLGEHEPRCPARFLHVWKKLGASGNPAPVTTDLLTRWSEPHRHYHTLAHLEACLDQLDSNRALAREPDIVELALWFHDAIYDARASDNEAQSARLAADTLRAAGLPEITVAKVERLILATRAHETDGDPDTALLLDIDLAILGAAPDTYQTYADAIRREYAWVPETDYRAKRAAILSRFLQRPRLFLTAPFFFSHERSARNNLAREIQSLTADSSTDFHASSPPCL